MLGSRSGQRLTGSIAPSMFLAEDCFSTGTGRVEERRLGDCTWAQLERSMTPRLPCKVVQASGKGLASCLVPVDTW